MLYARPWALAVSKVQSWVKVRWVVGWNPTLRINRDLKIIYIFWTFEHTFFDPNLEKYASSKCMNITPSSSRRGGGSSSSRRKVVVVVVVGGK